MKYNKTELEHPIDDPSLPSFHHPVLRDIKSDLDKAFDVYNNLRGCKEKYLPKEPKEPGEAYKARIDRSYFEDFFRYGIQCFAGILSKFDLSNEPQQITDNLNNIDNEGNSLAAFWMEADSMALRDGGVLLQVEMPPNNSRNAAEEINQPSLRPYFVMRQRSKLINWRSTIVDGIESLEWIMLLEAKEVVDKDNIFGTKEEPRYRMIGKGFQQLFKIERVGDKWSATPDGEEQLILDHTKKPFNVVPVVWYSSDKAGFGRGELALRQVMEGNIAHFQQTSDLYNKNRMCCMPVPTRTGVAPPVPGEMQEALVIGPNTVLDLPMGASFKWEEPAASSLVESRALVERLEQRIAAQTMGFLYGDPGGTKTARQAGMEGAQTESAIKRMAERKKSAMQSMMAFWCGFTGEQLDVDAGISMSPSIFEEPLGSSDLDVIYRLTGQKNLVSRESAIEIIQRAGKLPVTSSAGDEIKRLEGEEKNEMMKRAEELKAMGMNDYGDIDVEAAN